MPHESGLLQLSLAHNYRLVNHEPSKGTRELLCLSIQDFKGLERQVAIVTELDDRFPVDDATRKAQLYVAFSRPRHHLVVIGTGAALQFLFPNDKR
jgi:DNA helicase IV